MAETKREKEISGGLAALFGDSPRAAFPEAFTADESGKPHKAAPAGAAQEEALINSIGDEALRDALRERRGRRRGRPRKDSPARTEAEAFERATIIIRKEHHLKLREICLRHTLTFKEVMDGILKDALERYEADNGEVRARERRRGDAYSLFSGKGGNR